MKKVPMFGKSIQPVKFKKTLIGMPVTNYLHPQVVASLVGLCARSRNWNGVHIKDHAIIHDSRNIIVKYMLSKDCDGLLFIDSDQTFPGDLLDRLIETHKDIVGVPIVRKQEPYYPNIGRWDEKDKDWKVMVDYPQERIFQVDYIGMGFTYIRREVFEKLEMPYFDCEWVVNDKVKRGEKLIGEDVYFCRKAKQAGFKVWAYPMAEVGHIGDTVFTPRHYDYYRQMKREEEARRIEAEQKLKEKESKPEESKEHEQVNA